MNKPRETHIDKVDLEDLEAVIINLQHTSRIDYQAARNRRDLMAVYDPPMYESYQASAENSSRAMRKYLFKYIERTAYTPEKN